VEDAEVAPELLNPKLPLGASIEVEFVLQAAGV
jgi:hypothetical protein